MDHKDIIQHRLVNQRIAQTTFSNPEQVVSHLCAMQSQDWSMAKWAVGLRLPGSSESDVEKAFNDGRILRTHVLRPTWHFVTPKDIRWLLQISAPRVHTLNGMYYRKFELTDSVLKKSLDIMRKELEGDNFKTREQLNDKFSKAKIEADRLRLAYIMMHAELEGHICSGPRDGKQFTYALMDDRAPKGKAISHEKAVLKLASIYFATRGPATAADFAWWSGLKMTDIKKAIEFLDTSFAQFNFNGNTYIYQPRELPAWKGMTDTFLVPDYDEYGIGFKDRRVYNHPKWKPKVVLPGQEYYHAITVDGYHGGAWTKAIKKDKPVVTIKPFPQLPKKYDGALAKALKRYYAFFGAPG
jgi:hypothetical protein